MLSLKAEEEFEIKANGKLKMKNYSYNTFDKINYVCFLFKIMSKALQTD